MLQNDEGWKKNITFVRKMSILPGVRTYIETHQLLPEKEQPVIVGVSGGADSVALLAVLQRLGYRCIAAHCNFQLRGEESVRDEAFVTAYARTLNIAFVKIAFHTTAYASEHQLSIEMAARRLRYEWFEELRLRHDAQAIAVAHHRDDNVETVLMNLMRGTGIRGMGGMRPKNGCLVRPFLFLSREEITAWLAAQGLAYVTDSSNLSEVYLRNFIRLRILPLLKEVNPLAGEAIARTVGQLAAVEAVYQSVVDQARAAIFAGGERLSIVGLQQYPSPEAILYELLVPFHFSRQLTSDIFRALESESGKIFYSPTHRLIKDRTHLLLSPRTSADSPLPCLLTTPEGEAEGGTFSLHFRVQAIDEDFHLSKDKHTACFDLDKLRFPLSLRHWQAGDWFVPFGMQGRKKLSDYFTDHKHSRLDKEQTAVLCSGEDIIWIVGERTDERYKIRKTTKNAWIVNFLGNK